MIIEGRNPVIEALRADSKITKMYIQKGTKEEPKIQEIMKLAHKREVPYKIVEKKFLKRKSPTGIHQGVLAYKYVESKSVSEFLDELASTELMPFLIYIRDSENEYNIGSIIRSAECSGAQAVILPPKIRLSTQMVRASMGASEHINVINANLFQTIKTMQENAIRVIGIEVTGEKFYFDTELTGPVMFIIGGEDRPLSETITEKCDAVVRIPLLGEVNSLNMSTAASIVMYDKLRQEVAE